MKFAICQEMFADWTWERQCRFLAEVGYTGIELAPFTLASRITDVTARQRQIMRKQAQDADVKIVGFHWLLAKTEGLHITAADPSFRKAAAVYLIELGNACADLGGDVLVFGSPQQRDVEAGMSREQAYANAAEVFRVCAPVLADRRVKICMEPLGLNETNFVTTCAEAVELIQMVDESNVVLHQDVKAMFTEEQSIPDLITKYASLTGHFHANDYNRLGPGMGEIDFAPIFAALLDADYKGWVSVEAFDFSPGAEKIARDSYNNMQEALQRVSQA